MVPDERDEMEDDEMEDDGMVEDEGLTLDELMKMQDNFLNISSALYISIVNETITMSTCLVYFGLRDESRIEKDLNLLKVLSKNATSDVRLKQLSKQVKMAVDFEKNIDIPNLLSRTVEYLPALAVPFLFCCCLFVLTFRNLGFRLTEDSVLEISRLDVSHEKYLSMKLSECGTTAESFLQLGEGEIRVLQVLTEGKAMIDLIIKMKENVDFSNFLEIFSGSDVRSPFPHLLLCITRVSYISAISRSCEFPSHENYVRCESGNNPFSPFS